MGGQSGSTSQRSALLSFGLSRALRTEQHCWWHPLSIQEGGKSRPKPHLSPLRWVLWERGGGPKPGFLFLRKFQPD